MPRKKKVEIPEEFKVYNPRVKEIYVPFIKSPDFSKRFNLILKDYSDYKKELTGEAEKKFLASLYSLYYSFKNEILFKEEKRKPMVQQANIKLDLLSSVRIDQRFKFISDFMDQMNGDNQELIAHLIKEHLFILVEGELYLAKGEDSYVFKLEKSKKKNQK